VSAAFEPFVCLDGLVAPVDRANVDTDAILPKQFMKSIRRTGFGDNLFDEWRYLDHGEPGQDCSARPLNSRFELNQDRYRGASILLVGDNFGCGSSREHAPWALRDFGIRALIAPSFADIFKGNCLKNGLLPVELGSAVVTRLFDALHAQAGYRLTIDLRTQTVTTPQGELYSFQIDEERKCCLLEGLDDIAQTLSRSSVIRKYEVARRAVEPWIFD